MHLHPTTVSAAVLLTLIVLLSPTTTKAHNITHILAGFPDFSTFSHYLTVTHLADDINSRETITVCAVDNAAMSDLLSKNLPLSSIKNILSLHVLLDYFGAKKLHQITNGTALAATLYQATGSAPGSSGFVNITDQKAGKVALGAVDSGLLDASYVKSLIEIPYNISVIQISKVFTSPDAAAPTPSPSQVNLTSVMSAHGCKVFAETLLANPALSTFTGTISGGLTIFCPGDDAMKNYLPKFKNLTSAKQQDLLEYHGIPVYMSFSQLKSNNGPINTLATDGNNKYNFVIQNDGPAVTLKTKVVNAKILSTLKDEDPLAIFVVDKVLIPPELSNTTLAPASSPAPAPGPGPGPASSKHKSPPAPPTSPADSPADGPASADAADQTGNDAVRYSSGNFVAVALSFGLAYLVL